MTFIRPPAAIETAPQLTELMDGNPGVFARAAVKAAHHLDAFFVDMDGTVEVVVDSTRYWLGLFSHRRGDSMWKGMVNVSLSDNGDDARASQLLDAAEAAEPVMLAP